MMVSGLELRLEPAQSLGSNCLRHLSAYIALTLVSRRHPGMSFWDGFKSIFRFFCCFGAYRCALGS